MKLGKNKKQQLQTSSDEAIHDESEDSFQRKQFANRVATLLIQRESHKSMSIGIYGKWGEGKTSILNMVKSKLKDSNLKCIDFNPWMYSDEPQLLIMFFTTLQSELNSLNTTIKEKIGNKFKEYSSIVGGALSITGADGKGLLDDIGEKLAGKTLIQRKEEINQALITEGQKFVIFFDDIDRLTSDELFSIFRLIKLTGDFNNVSYVLAFDDEIVSKMLSERYSGEGQSYLEKIIQLPLRIPKAQKFDLNNYLFDRINKLTESYGYEIAEYEMSEIQGSINLYILPFVDNPRLIVRLTNSLEFVFPMLVNQANVEDLILIEWIKVRYPGVYNIIRENFGLLKTNFSEREKSSYDFGKPNYEKADLTKKMEVFTNNLSSIEKRQLENLIIKLFPYSKSSLRDDYCQEIDYQKKYMQKRICSPDYFERFFTYIVLDGQISDIEFDEFIEDIVNQNISERVKNFLDNTDKSSLAFKLTIFSNNVLSEYTTRFITGLTLIAHHFPYKNTFMSSFESMGLIKSIVGKGIQSLDESERLNVAKQIFESSKNIEFTIQLWFNLNPKKTSIGLDKSINEEDFEALTKVLFNITKTEFSFVDLIEKLDTNFSKHIILLWVEQGVKLNKEVLTYINSANDAPIKLVKTFCTWVSSSEHRNPFVSQFTMNNMNDLLKVVSKTTLEKKLTSIYGKHEYPGVITGRDPLSDEEIVGIYQQFCRNIRRNKRIRKNV